MSLSISNGSGPDGSDKLSDYHFNMLSPFQISPCFQTIPTAKEEIVYFFFKEMLDNPTNVYIELLYC